MGPHTLPAVRQEIKAPLTAACRGAWLPSLLHFISRPPASGLGPHRGENLRLHLPLSFLNLLGLSPAWSLLLLFAACLSPSFRTRSCFFSALFPSFLTRFVLGLQALRVEIAPELKKRSGHQVLFVQFQSA